MSSSASAGAVLLLRLKDGSSQTVATSEFFRIEHLELLQAYAHRTLGNLIGEGVSTVDAPNSELEKDQDELVYQLDTSRGNITIQTSNIMGVFRLKHRDGLHEVHLEITSRFDDDSGQNFLVYMLSKVSGARFIDQEIPSSPASLWNVLLALAFKRQLVRACAIGLYKEYREHQHNDARLRGKVQVDRHLRLNIPFQGKIAYSTREFSTDNSINHLFRHALRKMQLSWPWLISNDKDLLAVRLQLEQSTPSWEPFRLLQDVRHRDSQKKIRHPYFSNCYEPLRRLALALLRDEGAGLYSAADMPVDGVLFNGAWLWEEYLNHLFSENKLELEHPRNKARVGGVSIFSKIASRVCYPDFFSKKLRLVLDAKYKDIASQQIGREDLYQMISYMHVLSASSGGFVFPQKTGAAYIQHLGELNGLGGSVFTAGFPVPTPTSDVGKFSTAMAESEHLLCQQIADYLRFEAKSEDKKVVEHE